MALEVGRTSERRLGRFEVPVLPDADPFGALAVAQEGCAVLECSYSIAEGRFTVVAWHPDFDVLGAAEPIPHYGYRLTSLPNGLIWRRDGTFMRDGLSKAA